MLTNWADEYNSWIMMSLAQESYEPQRVMGLWSFLLFFKINQIFYLIIIIIYLILFV